MAPTRPLEESNALPVRRLNPAELKIDLLCRGVRVTDTCRISEDGRPLVRTRAGLGSGLEMILPGNRRSLCVNAPVEEKFARRSPYHLIRCRGEYYLFDERFDFRYSVELALKPEWYDRLTTRGIPMSRIGTLQGTCLSIYVGARCRFWTGKELLNCKFCTTGLNVGVDEEEEKTIEDVVETARAAREESGVTLVHLNGGFQGARGLEKTFPYLDALKRRAGALVGLQFTPEDDLSLYDTAFSLGADHFSFCFEFYNPDYFTRYLPGKNKVFGREAFFRSLEYCARKAGRGRVSGEIIAGVEPLEDTLDAIEYIIGVGAFPMVCVFRPLAGGEMQDADPPEFSEMLAVFRHVYCTCRDYRLPIGMAPNINVSLSLPPEDTLYLASHTAADRLYLGWLAAMKLILRPYFAYAMRPRR